jgi:hypothetical protein
VDLGQQVEQRSAGHRQRGSAPGPEGSGTLARVSNWGAAREDGGLGGERGAGLDWGRFSRLPCFVGALRGRARVLPPEGGRRRAVRKAGKGGTRSS